MLQESSSVLASAERFDIVALAASAGGLKALSLLLAALPKDFPVPLVVVQHLDPHHRSLLAEILGRRSAIAVEQAADDKLVRPGTAYIAPPDRHMLVNAGGIVELTRTELVHYVRPSADLLFESTAAAFRSRAIAVVLSGSGCDGATGVRAIKKTGGMVIVQEDAEFRGMPDAAREAAADLVLPLAAIAPVLKDLVARGR
jgi:two-component system chemotaxis response regulator CheB